MLLQNKTLTLPSPPRGTKLPESFITKATDLLKWDFPFTTPEYTQSRALSVLVAIEKGIHWSDIQLQFDRSNEVLIISTTRFPAFGSIEKIKSMLQMNTDTSAFQEMANTVTSNNAAHGNSHRNAYIISLPFTVLPEPYNHSSSCPSFAIYHVETDRGVDDDAMSNHVTFLQVTLKKSEHVVAPPPGPIKPPSDTPVRFIESPVRSAAREAKRKEEAAQETVRAQAARRIAELERLLASGQREMSNMKTAAESEIERLRHELAQSRAQNQHAAPTQVHGSAASQNQYNVGGVQFPSVPPQPTTGGGEEMNQVYEAIARHFNKSVEDLTPEDVDEYYGNDL